MHRLPGREPVESRTGGYTSGRNPNIQAPLPGLPGRRRVGVGGADAGGDTLPLGKDKVLALLTSLEEL
ncbi:hypothetical protein [Streptomyces sp. NPDC088246]|uniref:hypothetical protein n=1 Tax=Streptomyces sp. NPDC088246 TaxID=3365842 RepID=UPI00381C4A07